MQSCFQEIILKPSQPAEMGTLVTIFQDALSSEPLRRQLLVDSRRSAYWQLAIVGAIVVRWDDESEIDLLAVDAKRRGQGIGRAIIASTLEEARRRGVTRMLVGTGNFSLDNIAFYQKCGFRMHTIRRSYFDDVDPPEVWQDIRLRDMIVFDYELGEATG